MKKFNNVFMKTASKNLTLVLSSIVFLIISATMLISIFMFLILFKSGVLPVLPQPSYIRALIGTGIMSVIIATVLTLTLGHIPLRPISHLISATKELAKGNFNVRIDFKGPYVIKELSDSFNKMAEDLGSIELLRTDFINNFSHEFKTPIVSIKGFAKLLKHDNLSKEEREEYLDIIITESTRLSTLATNVLYLSKIETEKLPSELQEFDLSESLRHAILLLEGAWMKKGLSLDIELSEVSYRGNEELLNHVWLNLIDNAIKFSNDGGKISFRLFRDDGNIVFSISDNGIGMSSDTLKHIFDKFYQGDLSHTSKGNGLGLSMVKKIVELHDGVVVVDSDLNLGSTFRVVLPKR